MKMLFVIPAFALLGLAPGTARADAGTAYVAVIVGAEECMLGAVAAGTAGHIAAIHLAPKAHDALTIGGGVVGCAAGAGLAYHQYKEYSDDTPTESQLQAEPTDSASE